MPRILPILLFLAVAALAASGQVLRPGFPEPDERELRPKSLRDTLARMRIEQSKKDYDEMVKRGEEAAKITVDLDELFAANGRLTDSEMSKLTEVEKLVKKIRSDLGGDDDDGGDDEDAVEVPKTSRDAVSALRKAAGDLFEDLKKTSRFTISASAIKATNAILKVARFLRIK